MKRAKLDVFKGKGGWRWRIKAKNGRKVATSGEAFASKGNAQRALDTMTRIIRELPFGPIDEEALYQEPGGPLGA